MAERTESVAAAAWRVGEQVSPEAELAAYAASVSSLGARLALPLVLGAGLWAALIIGVRLLFAG